MLQAQPSIPTRKRTDLRAGEAVHPGGKCGMMGRVHAAYRLLPFGGVADTILAWLEHSNGLAGYGIMLLAFLVGSVGFPLPEEAVLAMGGYLAASGRISLLGAYLFGYSVVLAIDCLLYEVGRRAGPALQETRIGRCVAPHRFERARDHFARNGVLTVVCARFVMGTRIPVFLLAGALGVTRRRYVVAVALSGLVTNAIPVVLGYVFASHIGEVLAGIDRAYAWFLGASVLALLTWYAAIRLRRVRRNRSPASGGPGA